MNRRDFLQTLTIAAASGPILSRAQAQTLRAAPKPALLTDKSVPLFSPDRALRGVNLGGWLLLEKWISPSLFAGMKAPDEFRFGAEAGGAERLRAHRENYVSEADFAWIAARGLDAIRLPVGYWILESDQSYIAAPDILDRAFAWAKTHKLGVFLDLHGAHGSQNGRDHSGRNGPMYQCYSDADKAKTYIQHVEKAAIGRTQLLTDMQKQLPAIVGEWSLCLRGPGVGGASAFETDMGRRAYAAAQLLSYEKTRGWFFWSYKTESRPDWSLRECVNRGWMPESYRLV